MAVVFLMSLLLQIKPPTITGKRSGSNSNSCSFLKELFNVSRWKRSVEDNSELWSLDLGLRILGVKEVSCKRRLVRLNTSSIEHIKKKKKY